MADSPLVSVHVPKTAGTSFQLALHQIAGNGMWLDDRAPADPPAATTCIHGHAPAGSRLAQFPDAPLVGWLRHPVDRILSHFRYWLERPDPHNPLCVRLHEDGLGPVEFAEQLPDLQRRMLDVDLARFDFVGITEQADVSIEAFKQLMGRTRFRMPWINSSGARDDDDAVRSKIAVLCADEMELYRQGLSHLVATLRAERRSDRLHEWSSALTWHSVRR